MPRVNRLLEPGAIFHVMNRGVERRTVFIDDQDRVRFLELLKEIHPSFQCKTLAYCLMGNHFHLILQDQSCRLSQALRALTLKYARTFNIRHGRDGPLFRGRFKSIRILNEEQLQIAINYIHLNPLKDGFVENPIDWNWSSYKYYQDLKSFPPWMVHSPTFTEQVLPWPKFKNKSQKGADCAT